MKLIGFLPIVGIINIASSIYSGYAITLLWKWFIVPTFGLPAIGIIAAIGLHMLISLMTYTYTYQKQTDEDKINAFSGAVSMAIFGPTMSIIFGYIFHLWM